MVSVADFLDYIDPNRTIDRKIVVSQIETIALGKAVEDFHQDLNTNRVVKKEKFSKSFQDALIYVQNDFFKTHLSTLPEFKKREVLTKFPELIDSLKSAF